MKALTTTLIMWGDLLPSLIDVITAEMSCADLSRVSLANKHWSKQVQPVLCRRASSHLNDLLERQKWALLVLDPVINWDLGSALLFRDVFDSEGFRDKMSAFWGFPTRRPSFDEALRSFAATKSKHYALTQEVFNAPTSSLRNLYAALNPPYESFDIEL